MSKKNAPLLSVGIIFKNEIRCLERCLKSLQPLKEQIPCEIVMADTGSDDGSRAVAEKYADVVFDFPWVNDFAAARNAALDRCRGKWHLYIDCDEWLDEDITELVRFLKQEQDPAMATVLVRQRNYWTWDFDRYSDHQAIRIVQMSCDPRFQDAIHETPRFKRSGLIRGVLKETIFHHDGYVGLQTTEQGKAKARRNIEILREELRKNPNDLIALHYFLQAGDAEPDFELQLSRATGLVMDREKNWDRVGAQIYRFAIKAARERKLPQFDEWAKQAKELFSQTFCYRVDIQFLLCCHACDREDYFVCIRIGEDYEQALKDLESDPQAVNENASGSTIYRGSIQAQDVNAALALAYAETGQGEEAMTRIERADWTILNNWDLAKLLLALRRLHASGRADTGPLVLAFWEGIGREKPTDKRAQERRRLFIELGTEDPFWETESGEPLFAPLKGQCVLGDTAEMLETDDAARLGELLAQVDEPTALPARALIHALTHGAPFPPAERPLTPEAAGELAAKLFAYPDKAGALALASAEGDFSAHWPALLWARALTARAVGSAPESDAVNAFSAMRAFARVESVFLSRCYTPEVLEAPVVLPNADRLGRGLVCAFEALDGERYGDCVRIMRELLEQEPERKLLAEIMLDEVQRREKARRAAAAPPELLELAEKIRSILAAFPPDDPAVGQLRQSPAYQAVAWLIEES